MLIQLPMMFPSYDDKVDYLIVPDNIPSLEQVDDEYHLKDFEGHGKGGTNYWVNEDLRPTEEEAKEKLEQFNFGVEVVDFLVPDEVSNNIPYWIRGPFGIAPEVAEFLVEIDPLDRIQD